jgi:PAS domain S-box-containing protein
MLRAALSASGTGAWRWDRRTGVVDWDPVMEELCGLAPGAFSGNLDGWRSVVHPDDQERVVDLVRNAIEQRGAYSYEHRVVWPDGSHRWLESRGRVVLDDDGEPIGTVGCAFDITERKRLEREREDLLSYSQQVLERLTALQRIGAELSGASSVRQLGEIVVAELDASTIGGSGSAFWVIDPARDALELVAWRGIPSETLESFRSIPLDAELPASIAVRERRMVRSDSQDDARRSFPALEGAKRSTDGFIVVPLLVGDRGEGALVVGFDEPGPMDLDVRFLDALARHTAQSMARERLSEAALEWADESAATAERERRRREQVEFISLITGTALVAADHRDLMERVARAAVPRLGDWCTIHFLPDGESEPHVVLAHSDPDREAFAWELQRRFPFDPEAPHGPAAAIRSGEPQFQGHIDEEVIELALAGRPPGEADELRAVAAQLQLRSSITVPLVTRQGVVGSMQFVMAESGRHYEDSDLGLAEAIAGRVADALHAAWTTEQHRQISVALQQALLPPKLPRISGIRVGCRYWPGGVATDVGGDFYDLFRSGEGLWSVAIGDVCGTGADAAAVTAIARHTIRAAARHGAGHAEVIDWVNGALVESDRGRFCTLCYATLESTGSGTWALASTAAGHPLPVVRRRDGLVESLGEPGTLLGAFADIVNVTVTTTLETGDSVVFYTDGITDMPPPYGADAAELEAVLAGMERCDDPDQIADELYRWLDSRLPDDARHDDVALLVIVVD